MAALVTVEIEERPGIFTTVQVTEEDAKKLAAAGKMRTTARNKARTTARNKAAK